MSGQHLAAAIYSGSLLLMAVCFATLNRHILLVKPHRLREQLSAARQRQILFRSITGLVPYAIATALALVSSYATLAICAALGCSTHSRSAAAAQHRPNNSRVLEAHDRHHAPSTRRQLSHPTCATSPSLNPASASAASSFGVPATSPSGAGIVAPS